MVNDASIIEHLARKLPDCVLPLQIQSEEQVAHVAKWQGSDLGSINGSIWVYRGWTMVAQLTLPPCIAWQASPERHELLENKQFFTFKGTSFVGRRHAGFWKTHDKPRRTNKWVSWRHQHTMAQLVRYGLVGLNVNLFGYLVYLTASWLGMEPNLAVTILYSVGDVRWQ